MKFNLIEIAKWNRNEYFNHFLNTVPCTYSMTLNLDVTRLITHIKKTNFKLYPVLIYLLSSVVNKHEEFRTAIDQEGHVGVFDFMSPIYAVFQKEGETFTNIWTEYTSDFSKFHRDYLADVAQYGGVKQFIAKPLAPPNLFTISSIPWVSFTGFNLNLPKTTDYLLPIFTMGKYFQQSDQILLPISIQVHHAVCDGFHLARFITDLQESINEFAGD